MPTRPPPLRVPLNCRRKGDCRCNKPLPDLVVEPCPRDPRCICRWTWRDTRWQKGDDHALCLVHRVREESPD